MGYTSWGDYWNRKESFTYTPVTNWSPSRSVNSLYGIDNYEDRKTKENATAEALREALEVFQKNANILSNDKDGNEVNILVRFKGANNKELTGNDVVLNPALLLKGNKVKEGDDYWDAMDAMNGRLLLKQVIRRECSKKDLASLSKAPVPSRDLFATLASRMAEAQISEEWVGFRPYMQKHGELCHSKASDFDASMEATKNNLEPITQALCHNALSEDKIDFEDANLHEVQQWFNNKINNMKNLTLEGCRRIVEDLEEMLRLKEEESKGEGEGKEGEGEGEKSEEMGGSPEKDSGEEASSSPDDKDEESKLEGGSKSSGDDKKETPSPSKEEGKDGKDADSKVSEEKPKAKVPFDREVFDMPDDTIPEASGADMDYSALDPEKIPEAKGCFSKMDFDRIVPSVLLKQNGKGYNARMMVDPYTDEVKINNLYKEHIQKRRNVIGEVTNAFHFQNNETSYFDYGLQSGDIDEHAFTKFAMDDFDTIYQRKEVLGKPSVLIGLLIDQSGSMGSGHESKMAKAIDVAIVMSEAIKNLNGVELLVYGHTAQAKRSAEQTNMLIYQDKEVKELHHLKNACAIYENLDGYAIQYTSDKMAEYDEDKKILFVISDGSPHGRDGYHGYSALKHTAKAVETARKKGIKVFGIGIANAYDQDTSDTLFGKGNGVVIGDVESSIGILTRKIKSFINNL